MGRHSAPDDEPAEDASSAVALREREESTEPDSRGRHSRGDESGAPAASSINGTAVRPPPVGKPIPPSPPPGTTPQSPPVGQAPPSAPAEVDDTDGAEVSLDDLIEGGVASDTTAPFRPIADAPTSDMPAVPGDAAPRRPATQPVRAAAQNSAADLHLVRSHPGVLALCTLALLVPFAVEVVVLVVRGTLDAHSFVFWIWAPIIAAGILIGTVLDLAHRHYARRATPSEPSPPATA